MDGKQLKTFLEQAVTVIKDFFPASSLAFIPLLYSTMVWAIKRKEDLKAEVSGLKLWLEPEMLDNKPDEFILNFFEKQPDLRQAFKTEVENRDLKSLRQYFRALYSILGIGEPFLQSLFSEELSRGDYRLIAVQFDMRLSRALSEIKAAEKKPELWPAIKKIGENFLSLGWTWMSEKELRARLRAILAKNVRPEEGE